MSRRPSLLSHGSIFDVDAYRPARGWPGGLHCLLRLVVACPMGMLPGDGRFEGCSDNSPRSWVFVSRFHSMSWRASHPWSSLRPLQAILVGLAVLRGRRVSRRHFLCVALRCGRFVIPDESPAPLECRIDSDVDYSCCYPS